jgi:hypothetical protein
LAHGAQATDFFAMVKATGAHRTRSHHPGPHGARIV